MLFKKLSIVLGTSNNVSSLVNAPQEVLMAIWIFVYLFFVSSKRCKYLTRQIRQYIS